MIYWHSVSDFLAMGGYGGYVWTSFGVTALVMALEPFWVARHNQSTLARLKRQIRADARPGTSSENTHEISS